VSLEHLVAKAKRNLAQRKSPRAGFTKAQAQGLETRYSRFQDVRDKDGFLTESCLSVHRPDTPRPWLHLMGSPHEEPYGVVGSFCDPTGLGFLCYESVLAGPVTSHKDTSYVPTAPRSTDVREFYLREERAGRPAIWYLLPQVGCEPERHSGYSCCMHPGWMETESTRRQIRSRLRIFVPVDDTCEVWTITLTNTSSRPRRLKLFTRVNWGLESHPSYYFDPRVTSVGDHLKDLRAIVALNRHKANALPRTGFMMSSAPFESFDLSGEEFTGGGHFREFPRAVEEGRCRNSLGLQPYLGLVGALQFGVNLAPGASRTLHVLVGRTERERPDYRKHLSALKRRYFSGRGVEREFERSVGAWREMFSRARVRTQDEETDRLYNVWLKYQQHNTARFTRALDQMGYRDVLQDMLGLCSFEPDFVRNFLPIALNYQLRDGRAIRQFFKYPNTNAPNDERMYGDSPVWIADTLVTYLEETGDFSILDEKIGFYDLATHRQDNRIKKSVYEHALLALQGLFNSRGQKGLCLIGHGDWNDAMDGLSKRGRGVSTWLSIALVFASKRLLKLAEYLGDRRTADLLNLIIETMTEAVNASAWDGDHYIFGFNDDGVALGANENEEGRIHATVNAWALLSGVAAAAGREEALLKGMNRLATPVGVALVDIPYTQTSRELAGRIADVTPGQFENGAVYTHAHAFYVYGLVCSGRPQEAYRQMKLSLAGNTFPDIATGPPHQQSNFAVGPSHPNFGMNLYSNFTGSTAWYLRTIDRMVGVLPDFDGLRVAPAAPPEWREYEVRKRFRGVEYHFRFRRRSGRKSETRVTVDGTPIDATDGEFVIPLPKRRAARPVRVEVAM
jgi:cellobiose phosphorylase